MRYIVLMPSERFVVSDKDIRTVCKEQFAEQLKNAKAWWMHRHCKTRKRDVKIEVVKEWCNERYFTDESRFDYTSDVQPTSDPLSVQMCAKVRFSVRRLRPDGTKEWVPMPYTEDVEIQVVQLCDDSDAPVHKVNLVAVPQAAVTGVLYVPVGREITADYILDHLCNVQFDTPDVTFRGMEMADMHVDSFPIRPLEGE